MLTQTVALHHTNTETHIQHIAHCDTSYFPSQECKYMLNRQNTNTHTLYPLRRQTRPMSGPLVIMDVHMLNHSDDYSCVSLCACVCVLFEALRVFLLVVEVIWKECSGKGGASRPLNQQGRASNESAALTRADAN